MKKNRFIWISLGITALIAGLLAPFASSFPDGLERVAEDIGIIHWAQDNMISAPISDYTIPGVGNQGLATGVAGIIGVVVTFGIVYGLGKMMMKKDKMEKA